MKSHSVKFFIEETNINFYSWRLVEEGFFSPIVKKYCGEHLKIGVMKIEKDCGLYGINMENWLRLGKNILKKLEKSKIHLNEFLKANLETGQKIFSLCNQIDNEDLSQIKNQQFIRWFKEIWKDYLYLNALGFIPVISDHEHLYLTKKLTQILKDKKIKKEKTQGYLSILSSLSKQTLYWKEKLELLSICSKFKTIKEIRESKEFKGHVEKYFWLNYGYQGPLWKKEDFIERIQEILKKEKPARQQYLEHKNSLKKIRERQNRLEKQLELSRDEKYLFKAARLFMFLKAHRMEVRHRFYYISDKIFEELSKRLSLPITEFRYATKGEILKILSGQQVNHRKIISRRNVMLLVTENEKSRFIPRDKINAFLKRILISEEIKKTRIINGQTAFPGHVKGRVRIINSIKDMKKMNKGDILASISTMPDLLPAMMRAAAFITDQGGITSHAAIVAREMKKPCIIGTKIATKVLKDGDLVEVDADKGVVRILKKK